VKFSSPEVNHAQFDPVQLGLPSQDKKMTLLPAKPRGSSKYIQKSKQSFWPQTVWYRVLKQFPLNIDY
jgi:hypothetical protein